MRRRARAVALANPPTFTYLTDRLDGIHVHYLEQSLLLSLHYEHAATALVYALHCKGSTALLSYHGMSLLTMSKMVYTHGLRLVISRTDGSLPSFVIVDLPPS